MIGWYCDAGYANILNPTKLTDITITDFNRPFTLLTFDLQYGRVHFDTLAESIDYLEGINDHNYIYCSPVGKKMDYFNIKKLVPSVDLSYPNLYSQWNKTLYPVIYFKTLNKLILCGTTVRVYNVNGTNLTVAVDNVGSAYVNTVDSIIRYCVVTNYVDGEGIRGKEITQFRIEPSGDGFTFSRQNFDVSYSSIFNNVFGDSKPDLSGYIPPDNPYEPVGPSGPGGGGGTFDDDSDQIVDSTLPTLSSANTGFTRIYNPSLSQVQDLARYLWTDSSVIDTIWNHIKQFFENPMEAIIGFNLVPVPVPNGGTQNFALMYIDTGVAMTVAASQFVDVDCGTLELKEYYGSALDYSPNTKVSCFLPFIGSVSLNTDEVMGRTLQVKYRVDICSGSCVAKISVDGNFIYQYSGHCAINIPISAADFSSYVSSAISVAKLAGGALAAGAAGVVGAGAAEAVQQTNQVVTTTQITNTSRNPATGRQITTGTTTRVETRESPTDQSSTQASFSGLTPQNIANTVGQIMTSKPSIEHSGSFSGNSGYLGIRRPFLIIERPNMCMPANFQALNGFPSMITLELSTCKGFTRVQQVQLTGLSATNPEQAEILQLLKSGVIM